MIKIIIQLRENGYTEVDGLDPSSGLLAAGVKKGLFNKTFCCFVTPDSKTPVIYKYWSQIHQFLKQPAIPLPECPLNRSFKKCTKTIHSICTFLLSVLGCLYKCSQIS